MVFRFLYLLLFRLIQLLWWFRLLLKLVLLKLWLLKLTRLKLMFLKLLLLPLLLLLLLQIKGLRRICRSTRDETGITWSHTFCNGAMSRSTAKAS